jgi:hypothetical protein
MRPPASPSQRRRGTDGDGTVPTGATSWSYSWGEQAGHEFFTAPQELAYINSFGKTVVVPSPAAGQPGADQKPQLTGAQ